jgi:hypothetical protein
MRSHLHHFNSCMGDGRWRLVYQQLEELLPIVPNDWGLMMTTCEQLSWVLVDVFLVKSLGLAKEGGIFHPHSQLPMFLLAFSDTFIIDSSMRRDRQWQRAWRVMRSRPPDKSTFTTYSRA